MENAYDIALRALAHLLEKEPASHTASGQSNATAGRDAGGHGVVGGGHSSLSLGQLVQADEPVKTTWLGFQCTVGDALNLNLALVRRVVSPSADAALVNAKCGSRSGLRLVMAGHIGCFHARIMGLPIWE